jgi:hypothetical protein
MFVMTKLGRMRWDGHVTGTGGMHSEFRLEIFKLIGNGGRPGRRVWCTPVLGCVNNYIYFKGFILITFITNVQIYSLSRNV